MGVPFAAGLRFMLDNHRRFYRSGLRVYLRIKNFEEPTTDFATLGFQRTPAVGEDTGFTDWEVRPPPDVKEVSLHNIGLNQARLQFGAREFRISHTFVLEEMRRRDLTDPYQVFREKAVIGIFYNSRLFSIESLTHNEAGGETIEWKAIGNAQETEVTVSGS